MFEITAIYLSPGHDFVGRNQLERLQNAVLNPDVCECVEGCGIVGDRYFSHKPDYKGQITFFALEVHERIKREFNLPDLHPSVYRRNIITRGLDLNTCIGCEFEVQGIRFLGTEECRPCRWMDQAAAPGVEAALRGHGGLRARILSSGPLRVSVR